MAPAVGRIAFNIGVLLVILSLVVLPFLPKGSAEFVVDVIAFVLSCIFLALVVWDVRRQARLPGRRPPDEEEDRGKSTDPTDSR